MAKKTRKLELNKRTLKGVTKDDLARVVGGAAGAGPMSKPPPSHTCATCTTQCKTMLICGCLGLKTLTYDRALEAASTLKRALRRVRVDEIAEGELGVGSAGLLVAEAHLAGPGATRRDVRRLRELVDHAFTCAGASPLPLGLFAGVTGIAWAAEGVRKALPSVGLEPSDDVDDLLLEHVKGAGEREPFDLIGGWAGQLVYALERVPDAAGQALVERLVERLERQARPAGEGAFWATHPDWIPEGIGGHVDGERDTGLAHGAAGVVAVLSRACRHPQVPPGVRERAGRLMGRGAAWLVAQRLGSGRFPARVVDGRPPAEPTRNAWCYGDGGVAYALLQAGALLGGRAKAVGNEVALTMAGADLRDAGIDDFGLCHGVAGVAQLVGRLAALSAEPALRRAARRWRGLLTSLPRPRGRFAGYRSLEPSNLDGSLRHWEHHSGLLTGASGVALVLADRAIGRRAWWQNAFLLS